MVSLDRFAVFRAVVEAGSFTAAATTLNQARAAVSFNVKQLEAEPASRCSRGRPGASS